jgi:hypothetical protein
VAVPSCFETSAICFCRGNACTDDTKKWSVCSVVNRHTPKSPFRGRIRRQCRISRETSCKSSAETGRVRQGGGAKNHGTLPRRPPSLKAFPQSHRSRFPPPQPPSYSAQAPGIHRHIGSLPPPAARHQLREGRGESNYRLVALRARRFIRRR